MKAAMHTGLVGWCLETVLMHTLAGEWHQQPSTGRTGHLKLHKPPRISQLPNNAINSS